MPETEIAGRALDLNRGAHGYAYIAQVPRVEAQLKLGLDDQQIAMDSRNFLSTSDGLNVAELPHPNFSTNAR